MIPRPFEYHAPRTLPDALGLLKQLGDEAKLLAGGHSLLPMMKLRFAQPEHLIDLGKIADLKGIRQDGNTLLIGAMTTENEIIWSSLLQSKCPLLIEGARQISNPQVRYRGTIGGDIAHGDPGNDHPALMLALSASGQKTFSSPEEATDSLVAAVQNNDEKAMLDVLGSKGKRLIWSGDETEDAHSRANFLQGYREMHRLVKEPDGTTTLYIGAKNWPTPIPLVQKGNSWFFDTDAGKREILYRRIGRNELSAIRVCHELVTAENEFRHMQQDEFAGKFLSDEGQHNGLYWQTAAGESQSPIGPLVAAAVAEGYANEGKSALAPYRGYYFRILTVQGKNAPGGVKDYIVNGKMTGGFAFAAFPAEYRSSGVMTFIVGSDGVVYERDFGKQTSTVAKSIKQFDPDSRWKKTED